MGPIRAASRDFSIVAQFNTGPRRTGTPARLVSNSLTNRRLGLRKIASDSAMIVNCPNCATSYAVDVASLRPAGRQVRCQRCQGVWRAELPHAEKLLAAADALAPVRRAIDAVAQAVAEEAWLATKARSAGDGAALMDDVTHDLTEDLALDLAQHPAQESGQDFARELTQDLAGNEADEGGETFAEIACEEAEYDTAADAAGAEPRYLEFTREAGDEALTPSWPIAPSDVATGLRLDRFANGQIETEREKIADGLEVQRALAAQDEAAGAELVVGILTIVERRARRQRRGSWLLRLSRLQLVILALLIADAIIVGWRSDLVRAMPQTASFFASLGMPVNFRGVDFAGVTATAEEHDGAAVLVISGTVSNASGITEEVPQMRFAIRNAAQEEIYSWTLAPERTTLPAGEKLAFRSQIRSPPADTREILVSFVDRADLGR